MTRKSSSLALAALNNDRTFRGEPILRIPFADRITEKGALAFDADHGTRPATPAELQSLGFEPASGGPLAWVPSLAPERPVTAPAAPPSLAPVRSHAEPVTGRTAPATRTDGGRRVTRFSEGRIR